MKKTQVAKSVLAVLLSVIMIVGTVALNSAPEDVQAAKKSKKGAGKIQSVKVTNLPGKTLTVKKGKSKVLKVSVKTKGKKVSKVYTFKSSKPGVVKVRKKGKNILIQGKKKGKATVTIQSKANKKKKTVVKVTVGTPVSKVKVNNKKVTLDKGKTVKLKATVLPKKASNKKVIWKSSNKKVATVSAKGVVKAKKAGRAQITAHAADGSGKKAKTVVTVTDITDVSSVQVLNPYSIKVTLSKAQVLSANNFVIKTKAYDHGAYNKICKIDNVATSDNKTYYIILDSEDGISRQQMVQINITGLSGMKGTKTLEVRYTEKSDDIEEYVYTGYRNERFIEKASVSGYGYSKIVSVSGLPSGLNVKMADDDYDIEIFGKPSVAGKYNATIITEDELGNKCTCYVICLIGDNNKIVAGANPVRGIVGTSPYYVDEKVYAVGGSGNYNYEIVGSNYGLRMSGDYLRGNMKTPGTYNVTVKVSDEENGNLSTTITVSVELKQAYTVTGIVKDTNGNPLTNSDITFENTNKSDLFCSSKYTSTNEIGVYSIEVAQGTYDISAERYNVKTYQYGVSINAARSGVDITLPLYKIVITSNNAAVPSKDFKSWHDEDGNSYGYGDTLYLKKGNYRLTSSWRIDGAFSDAYEAVLNISVSSAQTVRATVTQKASSVVGNIMEGSPFRTTLTEEVKYYKFVPSVSGTYAFFSLGDYDTEGILYDVDGEELTSNDDGEEDSNFYMEYYCAAGETYYLGACKYSRGTISATLNISQVY